MGYTLTVYWNVNVYIYILMCVCVYIYNMCVLICTNVIAFEKRAITFGCSILYLFILFTVTQLCK